MRPTYSTFPEIGGFIETFVVFSLSLLLSSHFSNPQTLDIHFLILFFFFAEMASNRRDSDLLSIPGKRPTFTTSSSDEEIRLGSRVTFTENVSLVFYFNNHPLPSMETRDIFSDGRVLKLLCNPMLSRGECRICHKCQSQIMKKGFAKH